MNLLKYFLSFTKKEQAAIIVLLLLLFSLAAINLFIDRIFPPKNVQLYQLDSLLANLPKTTKIEEEAQQTAVFDVTNPEASSIAMELHPFPFDPNKLPEAEWKKIGLSERQIRNIKNYEAKGGKFFIKEDLKKIYSITPAEYAVLEPFIHIQSPTEGRAITTKEVPQSNFETKEYTAKKTLLEAVELNTVDSVQLTEIRGIGQWFAHRIIQYRTILGGFVSKDQLLEVYGIDSTKYTQIEGNFKIDASLIQPLRINRLTFKELIQHPYLDYNLTKAIVNQRDKKGFIRSEEELSRLSGFNAMLIQKLRPYLNYD